MIKIRQLGNGDSFHPNLTNTSFTLYNDLILVDCGFNVFKKLIETKDKNEEILANKIRYIFITHVHDDHIGSLMTFIYWNEFKRKKPLDIYINEEVYDYLKLFLTNGIYCYPQQIDFQYLQTKIISDDMIELRHTSSILSEVIVYCNTLRSHGTFLNTGYLFKIQNEIDDYIYISGDTKACYEIENFIRNHIHEYNEETINKILIFHDFSEINHPFNMHATEYDINNIYSEWFRERMIKVHNNKNFQEIYE